MWSDFNWVQPMGNTSRKLDGEKRVRLGSYAPGSLLLHGLLALKSLIKSHRSCHAALFSQSSLSTSSGNFFISSLQDQRCYQLLIQGYQTIPVWFPYRMPHLYYMLLKLPHLIIPTVFYWKPECASTVFGNLNTLFAIFFQELLQKLTCRGFTIVFWGKYP